MSSASSRLGDEVSFRLEPRTPDTHSLTQEELAADLARKKALALEGARQYRKKAISDFLRSKGVDPDGLDWEAVLDGNPPAWLRELYRRAEEDAEKQTGGETHA